MQTTYDVVLERGLPASLDAERSILGAIFLDNEHFHEAAAVLEANDFAIESHRVLFRVISEMIGASHAADIVTVAERLTNLKLVSAVGSIAYIASLTEGLPRRISIAEYVGIVREKAMLREIAKLGEEYTRRACDQGESAVELIAEFDQQALAIAADTKGNSDDLLAQSDRAMSNLKKIRRGEMESGYPLGIPKLDQQIGGLGRGVLTVVGGRPQMGKSCLVAHAILNNCPRGIPVHVFSIEMAAEALLERLWAAVSGVEYHRVHHPKRMNDVQLSYVEQAMLEVASWPLVIDDVSGITAAQLISRARVIKRKKGTQILAIDYLQKMQFKSEMRHRHQDITDACVALASFAKTEKVATMLLSSITEGSDKNRNTPPTLQHLRGSGDIAFEAHTVLLLHRKVDSETEEVNLDGELIIAKGRSDASGLLPITFHPASLTFKEGAPR